MKNYNFYIYKKFKKNSMNKNGKKNYEFFFLNLQLFIKKIVNKIKNGMMGHGQPLVRSIIKKISN